MINAPHDKEFVFHDGSRARNLLDLVSKLEKLSDHEFHNFVNHHKNDFANWTEHVLLDKHFSEKLRDVNSRVDTIQLIKDKINDITIGGSMIGGSIIHIPRLEDSHNKHSNDEKHDEKHAEKLVKDEVHAAEEKRSDKHVATEESGDHVATEKRGSHETHDETHEKSFEESHVSTESNDEKKEKHHEKSAHIKAGHNWFKLFSKKDLSEKKLEKIELEEEDKFIAEKSLKDGVIQNERENALWIILYFALVLLIITLLVYKLFL